MGLLAKIKAWLFKPTVEYLPDMVATYPMEEASSTTIKVVSKEAAVAEAPVKRVVSDETRAKLSAASKKAWEARRAAEAKPVKKATPKKEVAKKGKK